MKTGTCYFPSYGAACRYYRPYVGDHFYWSRDPNVTATMRARASVLRSLIDEKLNSGEIHIGKPPLKPGDVLTIEDNRYHVTSP